MWFAHRCVEQCACVSNVRLCSCEKKKILAILRIYVNEFTFVSFFDLLYFTSGAMCFVSCYLFPIFLQIKFIPCEASVTKSLELTNLSLQSTALSSVMIRDNFFGFPIVWFTSYQFDPTINALRCSFCRISVSSQLFGVFKWTVQKNQLLTQFSLAWISMEYLAKLIFSSVTMRVCYLLVWFVVRLQFTWLIR